MFSFSHQLNWVWNLFIFSLITTILTSSRISSALVRSTDDAPGLKLPLPGSCSLSLFFWFCGEAVWAWDTIFPFRCFHIRIAHGLLAPIAQLKASLDQPMIDRHSFVKHKALTLPKALILRDFHQIFQNPTLQMINLECQKRSILNVKSTSWTNSENYICLRMIIFDVIFWTDISLDEKHVQISGGTLEEYFGDQQPSPDQTWWEETALYLETIIEARGFFYCTRRELILCTLCFDILIVVLLY